MFQTTNQQFSSCFICSCISCLSLFKCRNRQRKSWEPVYVHFSFVDASKIKKRLWILQKPLLFHPGVDAVYNSHTRPKRLMIASVSRQLRRCASTEKIRLWHFRPNVMRIAKVELRVCFGRTSQGANRKETSEHRIIDRLPKGILGAILVFFFEIVFLWKSGTFNSNGLVIHMRNDISGYIFSDTLW